MSELTISPEGVYTDIEHDFIENEPPGLFPGDQGSTWGQIRSVYAAYLQVLADTMTKWYGNLDPSTVSSDDIPEWEYMLNLPQSNTALTDLARRNNIVARFQVGPFTRTRRRNIVESFITQTFGQAIAFDPTGVPFVSGGTPFYSGAGSLVGTYAIRENGPYGKNLMPNSSIEVNLNHWHETHDAGMTLNDFSQSAGWSMFGTKSMHGKWTNAADTTFRSAEIYSDQQTGGVPVAPGTVYTGSCYLNVINPPGNSVSIFLFWFKSSGAACTNPYAAQNFPATANGRLSITAESPPDAAYASFLVDFTTTTPSDVIEAYVDGVQLELVPKNLLPNPSFDNDVGTWSANGATLALGSTLAPPFGVYACNLVCTSSGAAEMHYGLPPVIPGLDYTFSVYLARLAGNRSFSLQIQWYDINVNQLRIDSGPVSSLVSLNTFQRFSLTGNAPANAASALVLVSFANGVTSDQFYVDGVQFEQASAPTPFNAPTDYADAATTPFAYEVRILNTITVDTVGLARELARITPAGITFTIVSTPTP